MHDDFSGFDPICTDAPAAPPVTPAAYRWTLVAVVSSVVVAFALAACGGGDADSDPGPGPGVTSLNCAAPTSIAPVASDGRIGGKWNAATQTLVYGRMQSDGHFRTFTSNADGSNERAVAYPGWLAGTHQFPAAWHPSGRYIAMLVEKASHEGTSTDALPGYGAYTDYWIVTADGSQAWKVFELPTGSQYAITHAAFSPDGSKFVFTERVGPPQIFDASLAAGSYAFNLADFVAAPTPHLANTQSLIPGGAPQGGEVESIASDNRTIAFYSTYVSKSLFATRIYTMDTVSGAIVELTTDSFSQAPTFSPDGKSIVYMSGSGADIFSGSLQGADWWIMNSDGQNKRRLTFMNLRGNVQSVGQFRLAGSLSFIDNTSFFGDVLTQSLGLTGMVVKVNCH